MKPSIALFAGDPAGIGPELVARLLGEGEAARRANVLIVAARASLEDGMRVAGARFEYDVGPPPAAGASLERPRLLESPVLRADGFPRGEVSAEAGRYMLASLSHAVSLCRSGSADAICFAPLNKAALRAGGMNHPDELHWFQEILGFHGTCVELNVLEGLWTSRVTSHVPLSAVAGLLKKESIAEMI